MTGSGYAERTTVLKQIIEMQSNVKRQIECMLVDLE